MRALALVFVLAFAACASPRTPLVLDVPAPDRLALVSGESSIHFIGIKNNAVAVPGSFGELSGYLDTSTRKGEVAVGIGSLRTGDPARDLNITTHVFALAEHPSARFVVDEVTGPDALPPIGSSVSLTVKGQLEIRRMLVELTVPMRLTREGPARVRLVSDAPLVLTSDGLGLVKAFDVLRAVCGHEALSGAVPIEVDLVFEAGAAEAGTSYSAFFPSQGQ